MKTKIAALTVLCLSILNPHSAFAQGTAFTYQGLLTDGGNPASGDYDLRFIMYNTDVGGSQVGPILTIAPVAVTSGLFTVTLDFGTDVFTGAARWLDIAVRTNGGGGFTTLSPRQAVTAAPYAMYATAAGLADNSVTSAKILDATIVTADLANSAVTSLKIADGTVDTADLAMNSVTSAQLADDIELGSGNANGELTLWSDANNVESVRLFGSLHQISTYGSDGLEQIRLWGPGWGELLLNDTTGNQTAVLLSANGDAGGLLQLRDGNQSNRAILAGPTAGGTLQLNDAAGSSSLYLNGSTGTLSVEDSVDVVTSIGGSVQGSLYANSFGAWVDLNDETGAQAVRGGASNVGAGGFWFLYNGNGIATVEIDGDDEADPGVGVIEVRNAAGAARVLLDGDSGTTGGGEISVFDADGTETVQILGAETSTTGGSLQLRRATGITTFNIDADSGGAAFMSLRDTNGNNRINLDGDASNAAGGGTLTVFQADGSAGVVVDGDASNANTGGALTVHNSSGLTRVQLLGDVGGEGRIGINRTPSANALEVEGNASKTIAGSWLANSDARIKTNVQTVTGALDKLGRVRLVKFRYTDAYRAAHPAIADREYLNVLAQEFREVFPDDVKSSGEKVPACGEEVLQVDTYPLTIYSAAAIQELYQLVQGQAAKLESKVAEIQELKSRLAALEKLLQPAAGK